MGGLSFELICESCLATRGVLESDSLPDRCECCGASKPWRGPFASTRVDDLEATIAESPFYLGASGTRVGASVVYALCTECTFMRAYGSGAQLYVPDACPLCGGELVVPGRDQRFPPAYVSRVSLDLLETPPL